MNVSYQHSNPYASNESFLLRFDPDRSQTQTACILVDAGQNVKVDELLADDEYLTAIVLTHAHSDHYQSLAANLRDGAPIYTSEATARILESVLDEAQQHTDNISDTEIVLDALEPLDDWRSPVKGLRIAPVPAGHTPGAAGFVLQFESDSEWKTILATGDWTWQRAGGYPGFDAALPVDIEAMFLTAATNDGYEGRLTESVRTICERASAGSPVLVSASGLTSVQYAYLLGHLARKLSQPLSVTLVGHAAKLYHDLDYDVPNVEAVAEFDDPDTVLEPETVTIAGPEVPTEASSGRLFGELRKDPNATLVQVVAAGNALVPSAQCTTHDFEVVAHPTEAEIDTLVEDLDPTQVIITHQHGRTSSRYKDRYSSYVWATGDESVYTIHEDNHWVAPPWMTTEGIAYVNRSSGASGSTWLGETFAGPDEEIPLPACDRIEEDVDLAAEGLDMDILEQRLRPAETASSDTSAADTTTTATDSRMSNGETKFSISEEDSSEAVASITARLDAIESQLEGTTYTARVVDAGDDITLLRVLGDVNRKHGQTVEVTIRNGGEDGTQPSE
ncbi:MBL fold metallo-hydrolase (plasmid) [Halococcus dombrowskii]|uniref:MBL fold metallo-hydrolase n=1 Tax=Halococcus dombrowskii TaxID=179637 RepID=A0AAV3SGB1_HALDO|nr:MBL fold metallo-hydrolase [Halococcus dombrowskii]UOO97157.1 MBL fold metallo-hydrolase [Halococcus dombrowskii]